MNRGAVAGSEQHDGLEVRPVRREGGGRGGRRGTFGGLLEVWRTGTEDTGGPRHVPLRSSSDLSTGILANIGNATESMIL